MFNRLTSYLGTPAFMRRTNGVLACVWVCMIPVSYVLHWLSSVTYVSALSIWALVAAHWATWQSAKVACKQEEQDGE